MVDHLCAPIGPVDAQHISSCPLVLAWHTERMRRCALTLTDGDGHQQTCQTPCARTSPSITCPASGLAYQRFAT